MKKFGAMLAAAILLTVLCTTALAVEIYYVKTPTGNNLNVRSWRDSESQAIGSLKYGSEVHVQEIYKGWAKIYYGSYGDGYVYAQYLSRTKPGAPSGTSTKKSTTASTETFNPASAYGRMKRTSYNAQVTPATVAGTVNLRWGPSMSTPIMGVRRNGAILHVIAEDSSWCQVYDESTGECGFMMKKFLLNVDGVVNVGG